MTTTKSFTRQELYELAWTTPMRKLASSFGISDVALAKHCRKAGIPLPGVGYWAKKDAGKAPPKTPLPPRALGQNFGIDFGPDRLHAWPAPAPEEILLQEIPPLPTFEDDLDAVRKRASAIVGTVRYPSLASPHPLVAKLLQEDEERRAKQAASSWTAYWNAPVFDSKNERRRLRIINALCLALARCGCKVSAGRSPAYDLNTTVGDVGLGFILAPIGFDLDEYHRTRKVFPNEGKLNLKLSWYQPPPELAVRWQDSDGAPLEELLTEIVVGLIVAGEWSLRRSLIRRHEHLVNRKAEAEKEIKRLAEEAKRKEKERLDKAERERREKLIGEAESWRRANDLRAYVAARLNEESNEPGAAADEALKAWAQWALAEADRMDPLRRVPDPGKDRR